MTNIPYMLKPDDQLCFIHIGKTAGTSLVATLSTFFQEDEICKTYHMLSIRNLPPQQLEKYRFFRGHFTYAITKHLSRNPVLITMLRNPVDRARSLYQHVLKDKNNSRHEAIKDLSLSEFIAAERPIRIEVSNWQTRILTDTLRPDLEPNLELAKQRLRDEFLFFGLTERYQDSLALLAYTLDWPTIEEVRELNKTPKPIKSLSPDLVDQILEINQLDQQLYDYAQELFKERLVAMQQDLSEGEIVPQSRETVPIIPSQPKRSEPQQKKSPVKLARTPLREFVHVHPIPAFVKMTSSKGLRELTLPEKSYIICANYRSGSTLLARALGNFKGAGKPSEFFSPLLMKGRLDNWGIDEIEYIDYIERIFTEYSTSNNVFGAKVMYPDFVFLIERLRELDKDESSTDLEIVKRWFPGVQFIYISRKDKLRQGISLYKLQMKGTRPDEPFVFDIEMIDERIEKRIVNNEILWEHFFHHHQITPYRVVYEDFTETYDATLRQIIEFLGLSDGEDIEIPPPPTKKVADELTEQWVERYIQEGGWLADEWVRQQLESGNYGPALMTRLIQTHRMHGQDPGKMQWVPGEKRQTKTVVSQPKPAPTPTVPAPSPAREPDDAAPVPQRISQIFSNSQERLNAIFVDTPTEDGRD